MKTLLILSILGVFGYLAYRWYESQKSTTAPPPAQTWPLFPTVAAPPQQFQNTLTAGPWAVPTGSVSPSYGIQP